MSGGAPDLGRAPDADDRAADPDDRAADPDRDVRGVVAANLPGVRVDSVTLLGAGVDHVAYEVNGSLIVRLRTEPDPARRAELVGGEARLLAEVAAVAGLPVPRPKVTAAEEGVLVYEKLPGVPLLELPEPSRRAHGRAVGATLGGFLAALHAVPADRVAGLVDTDDYQPAEWLSEATEHYRTVVGEVPAAHRRVVERFLDTAPPAAATVRVFSHNDLGIEHVLVDPATGRVTGVIDWGDAALTDPAWDFGLLYRDLGPAALHAATRGYQAAGGDAAALGERPGFHARCSVFEDWAYGLAPGNRPYADKSRTAMAWLFPA